MHSTYTPSPRLQVDGEPWVQPGPSMVQISFLKKSPLVHKMDSVGWKFGMWLGFPDAETEAEDDDLYDSRREQDD